jgi:RHS repeat-associated protein
MHRNPLLATFLFATLVLIAAATRASAQTETIEYYGTDAVGSVRIVFDSGGTVLGRQDYEPFGREILAAWGASSERFGGQSADDEAQQAYFHARQFQSRTGRFGSVDPVFGGTADPQLWNRYGYARSNPLRFSDYTGLDIFCEEVNGAVICVDTGTTVPGGSPGFDGGGVIGGGDSPCAYSLQSYGCGQRDPRDPHPGTTTTTPPTNPPADPPKSPEPPKPPSLYEKAKNLFGRIFGDELQNRTDRTLCVKPESGEVPIPLPPGEVYLRAFDGFSDPTKPGLAFKVVDFMSATVLPSGKVIPYPGPLTNVPFGPVGPVVLGGKQFQSGGWKTFGDFTRSDGWDPLFAASKGGC